MLLGPSSEVFVSHFLAFFICFKPIYDSCCSIFMLVALKSLSDNSHICVILLVSVDLPFLIHFEILARYDAWFSVVSGWGSWQAALLLLESGESSSFHSVSSGTTQEGRGTLLPLGWGGSWGSWSALTPLGEALLPQIGKSRLPSVFSDTTLLGLGGASLGKGECLDPTQPWVGVSMLLLWHLANQGQYCLQICCLAGCPFLDFFWPERSDFPWGFFVCSPWHFWDDSFSSTQSWVQEAKTKPREFTTCGSSDPMVPGQPAIFSPLSESSNVCFICSVQGF